MRGNDLPSAAIIRWPQNLKGVRAEEIASDFKGLRQKDGLTLSPQN